MLKRSIDPNCNTAHMRLFQSLVCSPFSPPSLCGLACHIPFWFNQVIGAAFSSLGCFSHSEEKAPLRFYPQIFPIQPTFQMFESRIITAARQALQNYTAKFSNTTKAAFIESLVCVYVHVGDCVCVCATRAGFNIYFRKENTKKNYLF